jgi:type I restriction enzyme R subunit
MSSVRGGPSTDPSGFKAQLVAVDRKACALYKVALDSKLKARGLPPEWSDVIISGAQNSEPDVEQFEYPKAKQDELIDYFKLTPAEWEAWNRERHGVDHSKWRAPLKILIVCDRLLTGFDAPVEQVMYLDKPLRDHNLLQAIARTNRPLPSMQKRTGLVVDYFGVVSRSLNGGVQPSSGPLTPPCFTLRAARLRRLFFSSPDF